MPLDPRLREKASQTERSVARLRFAAVGAGGFIYAFLMDKAGTLPWLAYLTMGVGGLYAVWFWLAQPYRRGGRVYRSFAVPALDAALVTVAVYATGGVGSPFYLYYFASVTAVAFRYTPRETMLAAGLTAACYLALLLAQGSIPGHEADVAARVAFLLIMAALASLLASESSAQLAARLRVEELADDLRRQQDLYESLLEAQSDLGEAVLLTQGPRVLHANDAATRVFGYTREELEGLPSFLHLVAPEQRGGVLGLEGRWAREERAREPAESVGLRKDGGLVRLEVSAKAMAHGPETRIIWLLRDIGDRKRAEEERLRGRERQAELERLREMDRFKGQFINMAAHELSTPLTPIRFQLDLLRSWHAGGLTPPQRRALDILHRNVERLIGLVQDVLEGARLQSGKLRMERRAVPLERVVRECVDSFREPARRAEVGLEARLGTGLQVAGDEKRLAQVLYNLLDNAVKFTPRGGRIVVEAARLDGETVVWVRDTGLGLRPEDLPRLFQPFSQVHDPATVGVSGTGLGLYISKGLIELHGGRLWAESPGPGRGATFAFALQALGPAGNGAHGTPGALQADRAPRAR